LAKFRSDPVIENTQVEAITVPFNKMRTPKFKAQLSNAFFAIPNEMFGGSSQILTTAEHCFVV